MSIHFKPDGRVYVSWREDGRQHTKVFGRGPDAEQAAQEFENRKSGQLKVLLDDFEQTKRFQGVSEKYLEEVRRVGDVLAGIVTKPIKNIRQDDVAEALERFSGLSQITRNRYTSYLKVLFNFAVSRGYIETNPLIHWKKRKEKPRHIQVSLEDLNKIYAAAAPHLKWVMTVALHTGVRPGRSELFALRWDDINWETNEIFVRSAKGEDDRVIPFNENFAGVLKSAHQTSTTPFLCSYRGQPISKIRRAWETAIRKANAPKCRLYDLRHFYATTLLQSGADLKAVSKILGHHSTQMTVDVYYHLLGDAKRKACQMAPAVGITV